MVGERGGLEIGLANLRNSISIKVDLAGAAAPRSEQCGHFIRRARILKLFRIICRRRAATGQQPTYLKPC